MRKPVVAGRFYPGDAKELQQTIQSLLPDTAKARAAAVVSPHAGYIYSGELACKTLGSVEIPDTVILLGPNHTGLGAPISLSRQSWQIPTGTLANNDEFCTMLAEKSILVSENELAHSREHSLEVQLPILYQLNKNVSIIPITVSGIPLDACRQFAEELAAVIAAYKKPCLMVASSDMSHFNSREKAQLLDKLALDKLVSFDAAGLYHTVRDNHISMCGVIPVTISLLTADLLGATTVQLTGYTDSGAKSGDTSSVVGYAGAIIS